MHESHLEPIEARPQSKCGLICSKMFKNLLLTLTVLGKPPHTVFFFFQLLFIIIIIMFFFLFFYLENLIKSKVQILTTTEFSLMLAQLYVRRRCHLCSDRKMTECSELSQFCATCCYQKLCAVLDIQTASGDA